MFTMPQLVFDSILEETKPAQEPKTEQLLLEIEEEPKIWWNSTTSNLLASTYVWKPAPNVVFNHDNKECGRFSWEGGVFKFEGNAETSAKLFANYVGKFLGMKVPSDS